MMRGVGGPLLCISDLLNDLAVDGDVAQETPSVSPSVSSSGINGQPLSPLDLHRLFEETYSKLIQSLEGSDHSWTELTLRLCTALENADKLISSANSNIELLLENIKKLESIIKQGDSTVATVKSIAEGLRHESNLQIDNVGQDGDGKRKNIISNLTMLLQLPTAAGRGHSAHALKNKHQQGGVGLRWVVLARSVLFYTLVKEIKRSHVT